jgi:hypothetical protein
MSRVGRRSSSVERVERASRCDDGARGDAAIAAGGTWRFGRIFLAFGGVRIRMFMCVCVLRIEGV